MIRVNGGVMVGRRMGIRGRGREFEKRRAVTGVRKGLTIQWRGQPAKVLILLGQVQALSPQYEFPRL